MTEGGYVKLFRSMKRWGWYKDPNTKAVFIELLLRANYEPGEYLGHRIEAGQAVYGRKELAACLGLSEMQVRTAIKHLEDTHEINRKVTNRFTLVTIEKWAVYQSDTSDDNQQITNKQPTDNQQITTSKNIRNKEIKNNNIYSPRFHADCAEIVGYLNTVTGSRYKTSGKKTRSLIKARMADGFTVEDFREVIDKKAAEWRGTDMAKFLRPETLFGPKFEGYLNQPQKQSIFNIDF